VKVSIFEGDHPLMDILLLTKFEGELTNHCLQMNE